MTAIAGFWAFRAVADPAQRCARALEAQQVYGNERPATWSDGIVAVGKRLFRTLDEDRFDHGPVIGGGGRWVLVADVRLDDRDELFSELGVPSAEQGRLSDSDLVMRAVERWQEDALGRLVGEFALALWDRRDDRLFLARDFLGQRPLHFRRDSSFFAFSSMPKGLHALPEIPWGPEEEAIDEQLALLPESGRSSFFRGIDRVLPGEMLVVTAGGTSSRRHWSYDREPLRLARAEDYAEAVREIFDRSVAARLRGAGGHVAAHLSGGLDSSATAATAARLVGPEGRVTAFTAVPREGYGREEGAARLWDEGPLAAAVAALYPNMDHVLVRSGAVSPFAALDRNFFLFERPVMNLCNHVWLEAIAAEARQSGHKVLLTGQSGNMSFSYTGLPRLSELLSRGRLIQLAREALALRKHGRPLRSATANAFGPFVPAPLWRLMKQVRGGRLGIRDYTALSAERGAAMLGKGAQSGWDFEYRPGRDSVAERLAGLAGMDRGNFQKGWLAGWGVDVRDPTADRRLVELCLSIPDEQYLVGGYTRALARRAFSDRLPPAVVKGTRRGLQAADWHEGFRGALDEAREEVERIAGLPSAAASLDIGRMKRLLENVPKTGWNSPAVEMEYRLALLRGISAGHFLRRATGRN
jgi:asparagine synthase (glutamine-hydrolysing)